MEYYLERVILEFLNQNPKIINVVLVFMALVILYALLKGRKIKVPFVEVGEEPKGHKITTIYNFYPGASDYSNSEIEEKFLEVRKEIKTMTNEAQDKDIELYQPLDLPERNLYIYKAKVDIDNKIRRISRSHFGSWAGSSLAGVDQYLDAAVGEEIISEDLLGEISNFNILILPGIFGHDIGDEYFFEIKVLATKLVRRLDEIPLGPQGPQE